MQVSLVMDGALQSRYYYANFLRLKLPAKFGNVSSIRLARNFQKDSRVATRKVFFPLRVAISRSCVLTKNRYFPT